MCFFWVFLKYGFVFMMVSRRSEDSDGKQCHISFHLHLVDGAQLLHAVFVIELVLPIHGDSEVLRIAADDHLKVLPRSKGEGGKRHLLMTPAVRQKGVPDKDTLLQARVQVESDVGPSRWPQVHAETLCVMIGFSFDDDAASDCQPINQLTSERDTQIT